MARIILLAHGGLAQALLQTAIEITGPVPQVSAIDLAVSISPQVFLKRVQSLLLEDEGQPVLFLTDLYGGTPWRIACSLTQENEWVGRIRVVAGMNLGMVLEACLLNASEIDLDALTEQVQLAGSRGICVLPAETDR
jgi:mannose/fructose-specific phosphotransferase system component IIA